MKKYRFVGLDKDVWLPDDIVVEISIVPSHMRNIRSNQWFTGQTSYTQHETANFNAGAGAEMHERYLHNGAGGAYVGFNFVVDDKKIIQLTPLNEVTWAAGTAEGNKYSYHTELCVNAGINHTVARRNAAALAGGILAAKGWKTDRLFQHNIWWGKDCPYLLRREGRWPVFVAQVDGFRNQALGGSSSPTPTASSLNAGDRVKTTANLNVRQGYGLKYNVVKTLEAGEEATIGKDDAGNYAVNADGYTWYNLSFSGGTGWAAGDWLEVVAKAQPVSDEPEIFDGTKDVTINGVVMHADKRIVTSIGVNEREWASTESPVRILHADGKKIPVLGWLQGAGVSGEDRWWITNPDGGRIWVGGTVEKP